jgi:4-hydroxybenzoate polyprenyltransferase
MEDFLQHFLKLFFGDKPLYIYAVCLVFAAMGAFIITRIKAKRRNRESRHTPRKFNFWFMIFDNLRDAALALSMAFIVFRFSNFWIKEEVYLFAYSFLLGLCFNAVVLVFEIIEKRVSKKIVDTTNKWDI